MMTSISEPPRRVVVIGSGLAGLTTAYLLRKEGVEVYLIEKSDRIGFHSSSVLIPLETSPETLSRGSKKRVDTASSGEGQWIVDVPMRSFQGGYYPLLISLYRHLRITLVPTFFTFSFSHLLPPTHASHVGSDQSTYFIYSGASGRSIPALPSQAYRTGRSLLLGTVDFLGTVLCFLLWLLISFFAWHNLLSLPLHRHTTLRDLSSRATHIFRRLPLIGPTTASMLHRFVHDVLVPVFSAVGTMTSSDVLSTPIGCLADYAHATVGTSHYTLPQGYSAAEVARRLVQPLREQSENGDHVRLGDVVQDIQYAHEGGKRGVRVKCRSGEVTADAVVLATQASAAFALLGMLERSLAEQGAKEELSRVRGMREALGEVEYRPLPFALTDRPPASLAQPFLTPVLAIGCRPDTQDTIVVTHRDWSVLPSEPDRREINLLLPRLDTDPHDVLDSRTCPLAGSPSLQKRPDALQTSNLQPTESSHSTPALSAKGSSTASTPAEPATPTTSLAPTPLFAPRADSIYTMGTHIIHPPRSLQRRGIAPVLQSTNPVCAIDPETVIAVARLERALPLRDPTTLSRLHPPAVQTSRAEIPLVLLAGSYAYPGIPLLEGCVGSAIRATAIITGQTEAAVGGVDWSTGQGSLFGRIWRWRREGIT